MAVYKCHHRCVCIHRGSYRLLDVLLPRRSALCISFPPVVSGPDASILIPTCYRPFQPPLSLWWNMDVCLSLLSYSCLPKSIPHAYLLCSQESSISGCPRSLLFPCFINNMSISARWNMNARLFSFCTITFFFFFSLLPLTGYFSQVSLWWNMNACPLSFSPPLTGCLSCASQQDEI